LSLNKPVALHAIQKINK